MRAKIDLKDAAALAEVRADLKQAWEKAGDAWMRRWKGALPEDVLHSLELIAINEISVGSFMTLLEAASGLGIKTSGTLIRTKPEEVGEVLRRLQREGAFDD